MIACQLGPSYAIHFSLSLSPWEWKAAFRIWTSWSSRYNFTAHDVENTTALMRGEKRISVRSLWSDALIIDKQLRTCIRYTLMHVNHQTLVKWEFLTITSFEFEFEPLLVLLKLNLQNGPMLWSTRSFVKCCLLINMENTVQQTILTWG